jgi:2-polyprenyl-6-methoxyphenol hydroxylase-like FAD-dependent oxidoreductase
MAMVARRSGSRHALVIGGSVGGLITGLLLRQAGWNVDVYERVAGELSGRGAGIVVQPDLIARLRDLGLDPIDLGVEIATRKIFDAAGQVVSTLACPQIVTSWERVFRFLRDAFPPEHYHRGKGLRSLAQTDFSVMAQFSDGIKVEADLVVGADGIRSTVRQQFLSDLAPRYAGYVAWRALLAEDALPPAARADLFPYMSFGLPPGEQFLGYPVAGPDDDLRPNFRRYNVVWYRPADESTELVDLLTDETGTTHEISIPPPLIRHRAIAAMHAAAERSLAPQFRDVVRLIKEPILQPIYDLETPHMAFGRVAILGDAAFVARPHVAAGVVKAADDAAALVAALEAENAVEPALKRFEATRLPVNRRIIERARHLGAYLQAAQTAEERARSQRHSIPEAVLAETATVDFLNT